MSEDHAVDPAYYLILALREEKAARESEAEEARISHLGLAALYRERATGVRVRHDEQEGSETPLASEQRGWSPQAPFAISQAAPWSMKAR